MKKRTRNHLGQLTSDPIYDDDKHVKHCEANRRYRRRLKYNATIPKFQINENEFFKLVPKKLGGFGGYHVALELMGLGYQNMFQLRRSNLGPRVRRAICDYLNVPHSQIFKRVN